MSVIWLFVCNYIALNNQITLFGSTYEISILTKILTSVISAHIFAGIAIFSVLLRPKNDNIYVSPLHICFASFICDFFVLVIFGSIMKAWAFGFATFLAIIICQALVMFFNVLMDTLFITAFQNFTKKYYVEKENVRREE